MNLIISLDQAKSTGVSVFEKDHDDWKLIYYDKITSKFEKYEDVIIDLSNKLIRLIEKYSPDIVLLEDVQNQGNPRTHKNLSMLLGALIVTCNLKHTPYEVIQSGLWRKILRKNLAYHGKRPQRQEFKNASREFVKTTFGLKVNDDIADSICIGMYYIRFVLEDGEFDV